MDVDDLDDATLVAGAPRSGKTRFALDMLVAAMKRHGDAYAVMTVSGRQVADRLGDTVIRELSAISQARPVTTLPAVAFRIMTAVRSHAGQPLPKLLNGAEQDVVIRRVLARHAEHAEHGDECSTCALLRTYFVVADWSGMVVDDATDAFANQLRDMLARMNEIGAKYVEEALTYKRPAQRSFWSKLAKRAAMVALVALLALNGFAAASPAARAAMIHWVETWTGSQVSYEYAGDAPTGELPFYAITALPDGYTLDEDMSYEDSGFRQLCYRSGDDLILFSYIYMQDDSFSYYDMGEDTQISEITVNGCKGKFFLASDPSLWSTLEWIDEESNLHFSLDASGDEAALRALAESVAVTEKTVDLSDDDEDENILTLDDIEGEKLPDEEAKP